MGKLDGIIKIQGTLDNLTFYKTVDGHLVRTKGGISKNRIQHDPAFQRTRENGNEFGHSATAGKMLRTSVGTMLFHAKDGRLSSRLLTVMSQIKNLDTISKRGYRNVAEGLGTVEGKLLLKGFDFNAHAALGSVLYAPIGLDTATGVVTVSNLIPIEQLRAPDGATHFSMQSAFVHLDFTNGQFETTYSPVVNQLIDQVATTVTLTPTAAPVSTGIAIYLVLIEFFQQVNGEQYVLNNGAYNVLNILDVV